MFSSLSPSLLFLSPSYPQALQCMLVSLHSELDIQRYLMKIESSQRVSTVLSSSFSALCLGLRLLFGFTLTVWSLPTMSKEFPVKPGKPACFLPSSHLSSVNGVFSTKCMVVVPNVLKCQIVPHEGPVWPILPIWALCPEDSQTGVVSWVPRVGTSICSWCSSMES